MRWCIHPAIRRSFPPFCGNKEYNGLIRVYDCRIGCQSTPTSFHEFAGNVKDSVRILPAIEPIPRFLLQMMDQCLPCFRKGIHTYRGVALSTSSSVYCIPNNLPTLFPTGAANQTYNICHAGTPVHRGQQQEQPYTLSIGLSAKLRTQGEPKGTWRRTETWHGLLNIFRCFYNQISENLPLFGSSGSRSENAVMAISPHGSFSYWHFSWAQVHYAHLLLPLS